MKVVVLPCGIKGTMNPKEMADIIEEGILRVKPDAKIKKYPLTRGYQPLEQCKYFGGDIINISSVDPYFREITASYGVINNQSVIIDIREASGLSLVNEEERNPLLTSTYGTGLLIKDGIERGYKEFYIFTYGSATNDGGIGILSALGYRFLDKDRNVVPLSGKGLYSIREIDDSKVDKRVRESKFHIVTDYKNLFSGVRGIAYGYGATKGANALMIQSLDRGLRNYAMEIEKFTGTDVELEKGTGAGGGVGAGLYAFLKADICNVVDAFMRLSNIEVDVKNADLVLTGMEIIKSNIKIHKGMLSIAEIAKRNHIQMVGFFASLGAGYEELYARGFTGIYSLYNYEIETDRYMADSRELLIKIVGAVVSVTEIEG